ncbi:uncharacterized protein STEHIDRAFT_167922 [Stereum hirsutum FP-91666 SS1]|uniref:uncharacterized protein n=1 Tax=Stereum hirsutum (strain FP-91666) TaxID=721885 RepID=UPI000440BB0F|nr:uncharacterized protein STEHIDRAFT_167922 [Stereum hirsutum FP-91666 SS1]EIM87051.1 hypothetical protein STEHIDRAFT_167922 [Stereum hirsutum FP-91666 SS1]
MSDQPSLQEVVFQVDLWLITNYASTAITALWLLDYVQTLHMEIGTIWRRRLTATTVLFLMNRYIFVGYLVSMVLSSLPGSSTDDECNAILIVLFLCDVLAICTTSALFSLRVYAIYERDSRVLYAAGLFISARVTLAVLSVHLDDRASTKGSQYETFSRCLIHIVSHVQLHSKFKLGDNFVALAFDASIFVLTLRKTYGHAMRMRRSNQVSIAEILLRDGVLYFMIMFMIGSLNAAINIISTVTDGELSSQTSNFIGMIAPFISVLPNVLVSRLVLNLRTFDEDGPVGPRSSHFRRAGRRYDEDHLTEPTFAQNRFLGNIGAPLRVADGADLDELVAEPQLDQESGTADIQETNPVPLMPSKGHRRSMPSASSMEPLLFEPFVWDGPPPLARPAPSHEPAYGSSYPDF